jgi:hypothetical protein
MVLIFVTSKKQRELNAHDDWSGIQNNLKDPYLKMTPTEIFFYHRAKKLIYVIFNFITE